MRIWAQSIGTSRTRPEFALTGSIALLRNSTDLFHSDEAAAFSFVFKDQSAAFIKAEFGTVFCRCTWLIRYQVIAFDLVDEAHHLILFGRVNDVRKPSVFVKRLRDLAVIRLSRWIAATRIGARS